MANTYKDIIITPSRGSNTADPNISFRGANSSTNTEIVLRVYPDANGTLSFEGTAGQLFSVTNDLTNTIFSVNDVSGIPSLEVYANGNVAMVHYGGNLGVGTASPTSTLHVVGNANITTGINTTTINVTTVNAATLLTRDGINVSAVAINSYAAANSAANTVRISANSGSTVSGRSLNFINTATVSVSVVANPTDTTNTNVSFSVATVQGTQGTQGTSIQGVQGTLGSQGTFGTQGAQGLSIQGTVGSQGTIGAQGVQGSPGPVAGSNNQILYRNSSNVVTGSDNLQYDGSSVTVNGTFRSTFKNGDEGGEIFLANSANTVIVDGITIDVYQNKLRFFEVGGTNRGAYIDMSAAAAGVGSNLLVGGAQGTTGSQGLQGTLGVSVQGTQGTQGRQGTQGTQGLQGTLGVQGAQGAQGLQGTLGSQGTQGLQGLQGTIGAQGLQGTLGSQGTQGLSIQGTQGLTGPIGGSNTQVLFNNNGTTGGSANLTFNLNQNLFAFGTSTLFANATSAQVGVGTATPSAKLTVVDAGNWQVNITGTGTTAYTQLYFNGTNRAFGVGVGNGAEVANGLANDFFIYDHTAGAARLVIDNLGEVGIGTTNPTSNLHVVGNANISAGINTTTINATTFITTGGLNIANHANAAYDAANAKLNLTGGTISGSLNISGNLSVTGNTTYINVSTYTVEDPLIYLAANNKTSDLVDIGFVGAKNTSGTYGHTGLARDASDATWYLFDNLADEGHVNNVIDFANTTLATLRTNINAASLYVSTVANVVSLNVIGYGQVIAANGTWIGPQTNLQGVQGTLGAQGRQGVQGALGSQGTQGTLGTQGAQGLQGTLGTQGAQGLQGTLGTQGAQGLQGTFGAQGTQGLQGTLGVQGAQGLQGTLGSQGAQGLQGTLGSQGLQGTLGVQGAQGLQGTLGSQGLQGTLGVQGAQGTQGRQGVQGTIGAQGAQGLQGTLGSQGSQGTLGTQGAQGLQGTLGTQGAQGLQGTLGTQGAQGLQGTLGVQGVQGLQGTLGSQGSQGTLGVQGAQGTQGRQGVQGTLGVQGTQGLQGTLGSQGAQGLSTQGVQGASGSGGSANWARKTTNYTAVSGDRLIADTAGGGFTITLPATPSTGDYVSITDGANFETNNLTVARNGSTIEGISDDVFLDIAGTTFDFVYDGTTWEVVASMGKQGAQGAQGIIGTSVQGVQGLTGSGPKTINFVIDGGGAVITTGSTIAAQTRGYIGVTANSTVDSWTIVGDVSGSIYVDLWKATYADFPTMTLISGTEPPRLVTAQKNTDSSISSSWGNTSLVAGDILEFRVNNSLTVASVNTVTVILGLTPQP